MPLKHACLPIPPPSLVFHSIILYSTFEKLLLLPINNPHINEIKLNSKEPIIAPKKLVTSNPGTKNAARANKAPFSITVKIPKVNMLKGKVIINKTGLINVLIMPITAAVVIRTKKPSTPELVIFNPLIVLTTINKAIVFINHLVNKILKLNL